MQQHSVSITDLPVAPDEDRSRRMRVYFALMGIRVACIGVFFIVPDWWKLIPAVGAITISYFAVVLANATSVLGTKAEHVVQREIGGRP